MTARDGVFTGSVPAIYEQFMVPMIFEPYARDLAGRVAGFHPASVLEIAAGTGVLTRAMGAALDERATITATDLNPPMLEMAKLRQAPGARITFRQADGQALPFDDQSFDVVTCQFGVMFFPDKIQGYREARRVLKPGGHYVFAVWGKVADNDFVKVAIEALYAEFPDNPPRFMERTPHGYHDPDVIRSELRDAGFDDVAIEIVDHKSGAASALDAATAYCQGNPSRNEIEDRAPGRLQDVTHHVAQALRTAFGEGPIEGRIRALIVTAVK